MIVRSHTGHATGLVTVPGHGTCRFFPLTGLGHEREVSSLGRVSGIVWRLSVPPRITATLSRVEFAPAVAGSFFPRPMPPLQDLARLFLNLSGSP